jgi:L-ascorbate metabolism protein UlaG (beta-lactamase superfamily)
MSNYINNSNLVTIKSDYLGNQVRDGRFINYQSGTRPSIRDILRWNFTPKLQGIKNIFSRYRPDFQNDHDLLDRAQDKIVWLGHASFLITVQGKNILIDPVFKNIPMIKRRIKSPISLVDCVDKIDYILISHAHFDHLDKKTILGLCKQNHHLQIYCGLNTAPTLQKWGVENTIIEAGWWQRFPLSVDRIEINFLPAQHWSNRSLKDRNLRLWGSFLIKSDERTIYFMGDSAYAGHFTEISRHFPAIDYAIIGIGAYNPSYIMQSSHLNPDEAYNAFCDLGAKNFIPMHYGTFILADEPIAEPISKIRELFSDKPEQLCELAIGEPH